LARLESERGVRRKSFVDVVDPEAQEIASLNPGVAVAQILSDCKQKVLDPPPSIRSLRRHDSDHRDQHRRTRGHNSSSDSGAKVVKRDYRPIDSCD
jgi:hypothetical protein